jgi:hypothetical protein
MFKVSIPQTQAIKSILDVIQKYYDRSKIFHKIENFDDDSIMVTFNVPTDSIKKVYKITSKGYPSLVLNKC